MLSGILQGTPFITKGSWVKDEGKAVKAVSYFILLPKVGRINLMNTPSVPITTEKQCAKHLLLLEEDIQWV